MKKFMTGSVVALSLVLGFGTTHAVEQNFVTLEQVYERFEERAAKSALIDRISFIQDKTDRRSSNFLPSKHFKNR